MPCKPTAARRRRPAAVRIGAGLLLAGAATTAAPAAAPPDARWMAQYAGHSTNEAMGDPRMAGILAGLVPAGQFESVQDNLGGPPGPVTGSGPDIVLSACRPHDCGDKAFVWIDTSASAALSATAECPGLPDARDIHRWNGCRLSLGSLAYDGATLPPRARDALRAWLVDEDLQVDAVEFVGRDGVARALDPRAYRVPPVFQPPAGGPSFDCAKARTAVETAVCASPELSAQDLELDRLYDQIRRGTSAAPARDELRALEQAWLQSRDETCATAPDPASCLRDAYRDQTTKLGNWIPARHAR